jgi:predicted DNA binding CopG/RHH family protein
MSPKKVNISPKPGTSEKPANIEEWVANRLVEPSTQEPPTEEKPEKMKRLTLDIPEWLHRAIKRKAVEEGVTMADQLRVLLEKHYGDERG